MAQNKYILKLNMKNIFSKRVLVIIIAVVFLLTAALVVFCISKM